MKKYIFILTLLPFIFLFNSCSKNKSSSTLSSGENSSQSIATAGSSSDSQDSVEPKDCKYNGKSFKHGEEFTCKIKCNMCNCDDGMVYCTNKACVDEEEAKKVLDRLQNE